MGGGRAKYLILYGFLPILPLRIGAVEPQLISISWEGIVVNMIGICGDDCSHCPRYAATQKGSKDELEKVKELWVRLGFRDSNIPAQELVCHGCGPENQCAYSEVRACVYAKGIESCGSCDSYPCELVNAVFEKSEKLRSQAARICTPKEMEVLQKAFFSKKENLDRKYLESHKKQGRY